MNKFDNEWYNKGFDEGFEDGYDAGYNDFRFVLVESADREINAECFDSLEKAQQTMRKFYEEAGSAADEYFGEEEAWKTDANNHANYDWKIIKLGEKQFVAD